MMLEYFVFVVNLIFQKIHKFVFYFIKIIRINYTPYLKQVDFQDFLEPRNLVGNVSFPVI